MVPSEDVAAMVAMPIPTPVANPLFPTLLLIVTKVVSLELQVTEAVRSWVLASVNVPAAVNCCVAPRTTEGFTGIILNNPRLEAEGF